MRKSRDVYIDIQGDSQFCRWIHGFFGAPEWSFLFFIRYSYLRVSRYSGKEAGVKIDICNYWSCSARRISTLILNRFDNIVPVSPKFQAIREREYPLKSSVLVLRIDRESSPMWNSGTRCILICMCMSINVSTSKKCIYTRNCVSCADIQTHTDCHVVSKASCCGFVDESARKSHPNENLTESNYDVSRHPSLRDFPLN